MNTFATVFLRRVMLADAALSGATGAAQLAAGHWLSGLLGLPAGLLYWTGLVLVAYALAVAWLARRPGLSPPAVRAVIGVNLVWALGCVGLLLPGWVRPGALGVGWVLLQAAVVLVFAGLQYLCLRRPRAHERRVAGAPT